MNHKNKKEPGTLKKQLVSGAVYIALAVTVVAVTLSTITSTMSGSKTPIGVSDDTIYKHDTPDVNLRLPDPATPNTDSGIQKPTDVENFTLDTPVADLPQGVDATVTENGIKADEPKGDTASQTPDASESEQPSSTAPLVKEPDAPEGGENVPDKKRPLSEEPAEQTFEVGYSGFIKPCAGYVGKEFSVDVPVYSATMYDYRTHSGIDIVCEVGSPVKAVTNGVISDVYHDDLYGTTVVIEHADGVTSIYQGLSPELPAETVAGRSVLTGETIGGIGNSALIESAEASHLHFEMTKDGKAVDPRDYIG